MRILIRIIEIQRKSKKESRKREIEKLLLSDEGETIEWLSSRLLSAAWVDWVEFVTGLLIICKKARWIEEQKIIEVFVFNNSF